MSKYTEVSRKGEIKDNLYSLYDHYKQHKLLYAFYQKYKDIKNEDDILERIEYLKKNPEVKQKTELETLLWCIDELD